MTYARFHAIFTLPPLVFLAIFTPDRFRSPEALIAAGAVLAAALVFTTPWDVHAIAQGIWHFPPGKYVARILGIPVEEYAFFLIQTALVIGTVNVTLGPPADRAGLPNVEPASLAFIVPAAAFLVAWVLVGQTIVPAILRRSRRAHYALHLFYWFAPIIVLQWILAWPLFLPVAGRIALATCLSGTWLTIADHFALRSRVWVVDPGQVTGATVGKVMPWEEVAFFYVTSLLVAQSYVMLLPQHLW